MSVADDSHQIQHVVGKPWTKIQIPKLVRLTPFCSWGALGTSTEPLKGIIKPITNTRRKQQLEHEMIPICISVSLTCDTCKISCVRRGFSQNRSTQPNFKNSLSWSIRWLAHVRDCLHWRCLICWIRQSRFPQTCPTCLSWSWNQQVKVRSSD